MAQLFLYTVTYSFEVSTTNYKTSLCIKMFSRRTIKKLTTFKWGSSDSISEAHYDTWHFDEPNFKNSLNDHAFLGIFSSLLALLVFVCMFPPYLLIRIWLFHRCLRGVFFLQDTKVDPTFRYPIVSSSHARY